MKFNNPYWSTKTKIELLQKWILIHSYIYYEMDKNVVTDQMFDSNGNQLRELMQSDSKASKASKWGYVFYDFTGSTGFHLYDRLTPHDKIDISQTAEYVAVLMEYKGVIKIGKQKIN